MRHYLGVSGLGQYAVWARGAGLTMGSNRTTLIVVIGAVAVAALLWIFRDDLGKRALPPQATAPTVPSPTAPPTSATTAPAPSATAAAPPPPTPAAPPAPTPEILAIRPSFDIVRVGSDCRAVMAGRAAPGAMVVVVFGANEIGRVNADQNGEWTLVPDLPLQAGSAELNLTSQLVGQARPNSTEKTVVLSVPDCVPGRSTGGEQAIAVLTGPQGASRVLQRPSATGELPAGKTLSLDVIDYDEKGALVLSGRAPPHSTVQVYINNEPIAAAEADANGQWTVQPKKDVPPGIYTLRIDQVAEPSKPAKPGEAPKVASRIELPFKRADAADIQFGAGQTVIVQPGNSLWRIARQVYGEGLRYTDIFAANKEQIRDPDLIYPGQVFSVPSNDAAHKQ